MKKKKCRYCDKKFIDISKYKNVCFCSDDCRKNHKVELKKINRRIERQVKKNDSLWKKKKIARDLLLKDKIKHPEKYENRNCFICAKPENIEFHHPDYDKPLEVIAVCRYHHIELHKQLNKK